MNKTVVLAFSGGLDTSFCVPYLIEQGYQVVTAFVDSGGVSKEEKTAIFDTVWAPFSEEYVRNLAREIELGKIDYVIAPHAEIDHSGALPLLMSQIPDTPIYCSKNGAKSLKHRE